MLDGLGYRDVCRIDFENAKAQTQAREAIVREFKNE